MGYQRPVSYSRSTSWASHRRRNPPSSEPGIDMFCAIGTPVLAAESGRIVDTGDSIGPATGRFVTIDLDDGRRVRYLHLKSRTVRVGDRVRRSQVIGYSGATGYGEEDWSWNVAETGGAHVHMTLWLSQRYVFGSYGAVDPEPYFDADGAFAGDEATPAKPKEWDEMASRDDIKTALVEAFDDDRVTDLIAEAVQNELAKMKSFADLSLIPIAERNDAMDLHAASTQRRIRVQNTAHLEFIRRAAQNRGGDRMSSSEVDIFDGYCAAVYPPVGKTVDTVALSAALKVVEPSDEAAALVNAAVTACTADAPAS